MAFGISTLVEENFVPVLDGTQAVTIKEKEASTRISSASDTSIVRPDSFLLLGTLISDFTFFYLWKLYPLNFIAVQYDFIRQIYFYGFAVFTYIKPRNIVFVSIRHT